MSMLVENYAHFKLFARFYSRQIVLAHLLKHYQAVIKRFIGQIIAKPANVLVLDEPTNDLDMATLELLEDFVVNFKGTVLLISHDRAFMDNVVTQTWVFDTDKYGDGIFGIC